MTSKKRVIHLITGLSRGGAEAMLYRLLTGLNHAHFETIVISLTVGGIYEDKIEALGIPVYSLKMRSGVPDPLALIRLRRFVAQYEPDVIHAWMYHAGLLALIAAIHHPIIIAIRQGLHDLSTEKALTRLVISTLGRISYGAKCICYNSDISRKQHEAIGYCRERGVVIPNGLDCVLFRPMPELRQAVRNEIGVPDDSFAIGHLGRYHEIKDHAGLLEAFSRIARHVPKLRLVMAGTGVEAGNHALMEMITRFGISDRVQLLGEQDDIPHLVNSFDILVNASRSEAFPNVLCEAMACEVPCVATDVGDSAHIIGDTGIIVPPRDPEALAEAMLELAHMSEEKRALLGTRARNRVVENFSLAKIAQSYEDLYEHVLKKTFVVGSKKRK